MRQLTNLLAIICVFSTNICLSQTVKFRKVIGSNGYDYGMSAVQMFNKGYITAGSTTSFGSGNTDIYIVKTDSLGLPYDDAYFGGINIDRANCIRQTADSGFVILGYTNSLGAGGYDIYLIKTDEFLNIQWSKTYGGADWDFGNCIEQTTDGGYIICGSTYSYGAGDQDYFMIKTNASGVGLWSRTFGGAKQDEAKSVIQTSDGGYAITGFSKSMGDT
nr:hypothetical protein [Bacteroidota bacterium]